MSTTKDLHAILKQLKIITKYGVGLICLLMTTHCGLVYFGHDVLWFNAFFPVFLTLLGLKLSSTFGLCWVHKLSVVYTTTVLLCVIMRHYGAFARMGLDIHITRVILFITGLTLCTLNVWKLTDKNS